MALRDMEHDRPRLEQSEIACFIGRDLPERMQRAMRRLLHLGERNQANVVGLTDFFQSPANAHVTRESGATIGGSFKGGNGGGLLHRYQRPALLPAKIGHVGDRVQWPLHRATVGKQVSTMS